jgi:hypothetical protein
MRVDGGEHDNCHQGADPTAALCDVESPGVIHRAESRPDRIQFDADQRGERIDRTCD